MLTSTENKAAAWHLKHKLNTNHTLIFAWLALISNWRFERTPLRGKLIIVIKQHLALIIIISQLYYHHVWVSLQEEETTLWCDDWNRFLANNNLLAAKYFIWSVNHHHRLYNTYITLLFFFLANGACYPSGCTKECQYFEGKNGYCSGPKCVCK